MSLVGVNTNISSMDGRDGKNVGVFVAKTGSLVFIYEECSITAPQILSYIINFSFGYVLFHPY